MARSDTTIAVNGERKGLLKDAVVKVTIETLEPIKSSALVHYLIDNYLDDAVNDIIEKKKNKEK